MSALERNGWAGELDSLVFEVHPEVNRVARIGTAPGHAIEVPAVTLTLLQPILGQPFCAPEIERRCQLARIVAGLQAGPQPAPLLRARRP